MCISGELLVPLQLSAPADGEITIKFLGNNWPMETISGYPSKVPKVILGQDGFERQGIDP
jgi:hypothetical protein